MTDIFPIIIASVCTALLGGTIGFHIGYATRNPKRKAEHSSLHTTRYPVDAPPIPAPTQGDPRRFCSAYALYVLLYDQRYDIYRWDDIAQVHLNSKEGLLAIKLHGGEEHHYSSDWGGYGIEPVYKVIHELNEDIDKD